MIEKTLSGNNNHEITILAEKRFADMTRLSWRYKKCFSLRGEEFDMSANEMALLLLMHNFPEVNTANRIKNELGITKGMVSRYVDEMISKGYIRAEQDSKDRRVIRLHLCDKAVAISKKVDSDGRNFFISVMNGIEPEKIISMIETMEQISANIDSLDVL